MSFHGSVPSRPKSMTSHHLQICEAQAVTDSGCALGAESLCSVAVCTCIGMIQDGTNIKLPIPLTKSGTSIRFGSTESGMVPLTACGHNIAPLTACSPAQLTIARALEGAHGDDLGPRPTCSISHHTACSRCFSSREYDPGSRPNKREDKRQLFSLSSVWSL